MTTVEYKGKAIDLELNQYALRKFGEGLNANTPGEAREKLITAMSGGELTYEKQDVIAMLFYQMNLTACEIKRVEPQLVMAECYDLMYSPEATKALNDEIVSFLPEPDTVKKNEVKATEKAVAMK